MSNINNLIPKAGQIDVPDPPNITAVDFIRQVIDNINAQMLQIDSEVYKASVGDTAYVKALYDSVHEIKSRAEQADMILTQIVNDPKTLENVNARIEGPADTHGKIKKLILSVQELENELREGEFDYYRIVAELLIEVQEQMEHFKVYIATPQISSIQDKIQAIEKELGRQVQWSFREIGPLVNTDPNNFPSQEQQDPNEIEWNVDVSALSQIYLIVDALGEKFRNDLLQRFAQLQLIPYEKIFKIGNRYATLDGLSTRFSWFKFLLRVVDAKLSSIIPASWRVDYHLYNEFIRRTKNHLNDILAEGAKEHFIGDNSDLKSQVAFLIKAIKTVITFEAEMNASFQAKEDIETAGRIEDTDNSNTSSRKSTQSKEQETIRDAFDPYLGCYVQLEREGLEELMQSMLRKEDEELNSKPSLATSAVQGSNATNTGNGIAGNTSRPEDPIAPVVAIQPGEPFESSQKLFEYIKQSLKRCTGFSTGMTFLSLSKEFRINLQEYAQALKFRCPTPDIPEKNNKPAVYVISKKIETTLCRIICTGEYCIDTIPALENIMKMKIQSKFEQEVDFSQQIDIFNDTISYTMKILALGEIQRMKDYFEEMRTSVNWSSVDSVAGEENKYVRKMLKILADCVPRIRLWVSSVYLQQVCIKLVTTFLDQFLENIWSLKRVSKAGGGQLLLDLNGIKEFLLKLPNCKLPEGKEPMVIGKAYLSIVNSKAKKIENILKLVCTEDSMMDETFALLWPEATSNEMDQILYLKGSKSAIINAPIVKGKEILDNGKKITKGAVGGIAGGFTTVGTKINNTFGDLLKGDLFHDDGSSRHSGGGSSSHGATTTATGDNNTTSHASSTSGAQQKFKQAFSGVQAALNFKKTEVKK